MKKHLLLFALLLSAAQLAFAQDVTLSGTVLCADGTQFNSNGVNYIFMTQDSTICCVDSVGIPLDANGNFDYTFPGESQGIVTLWYANADGIYIGASAYYYPGNTSLEFTLDACPEEEEPCMVDITFGADSLLDGAAYVFLNAYTNVVDPVYNWTFGDGGTSSEENPVHIYNETGTYTICVTVSGSGCTASDCIDITVDAEGNGQEGGGMMVQGFTLVVNGNVSSTTELESSEISVYPNPINAGNQLFLAIQQSIQGELTLCTSTGRIIEKSTMNFASGINVLPINTSQLTPGIYILQLCDQSGKTHQFKLIY